MQAIEATIGQVYQTTRGHAVRVIKVDDKSVHVQNLKTQNVLGVPHSYELYEHDGEMPAAAPEPAPIKTAPKVKTDAKPEKPATPEPAAKTDQAKSTKEKSEQRPKVTGPVGPSRRGIVMQHVRANNLTDTLPPEVRNTIMEELQRHFPEIPKKKLRIQMYTTFANYKKGITARG